jgi:hypothetical protein
MARSMRIGLAVALVSGLAAVAPASGHEFTAKTAPGTSSGKGTSNQVFTMTVGKWACERMTIAGSVASTKSAALTAKVKLSECEAFGGKLTINEAVYTFNANESLQIDSRLVITNSVGKCSVKFEPQGPLWTVKYRPIAGKIRITQAIDGMKYTASGGECGASGVEMVNGEYGGEAELEEVGGGLGWI